MLRYCDEQANPDRIQRLTSLTVDQFEELVAPFEQAFRQYMTRWTMEGKPRTARAYTPYGNSPLPTAHERLFFLLTYLKAAPLQEVHGALFAMSQSNANKWIHILLIVLRDTLSTLGDAPARHVVALRERLTEVLSPHAPAPEPDSSESPPLFTMMARSDQSRVPKTRMNRNSAIAARKSAIP